MLPAGPRGLIEQIMVEPEPRKPAASLPARLSLLLPLGNRTRNGRRRNRTRSGGRRDGTPGSRRGVDDGAFDLGARQARRIIAAPLQTFRANGLQLVFDRRLPRLAGLQELAQIIDQLAHAGFALL